MVGKRREEQSLKADAVVPLFYILSMASVPASLADPLPIPKVQPVPLLAVAKSKSLRPPQVFLTFCVI